MAREGILTVYDIDDAKIKVVTADTSSGITYGSAVDVPGIQSISMQLEITNKQLYGDAKELDTATNVRAATGACRHAQISLPLLAALLGQSTPSTSGSSPNETLEVDILGTDKPAYFKLEGQCKYQGGPLVGGSGDAHMVIHKAKITNIQQEWQSEEYAIVSFDFRAIPTIYNSKCVTFRENETAAAIS